MIDHIAISVNDFEESKAFYKAVLAPLGYLRIMEFQGWAGFSADGRPDSCWGFWIQGGKQVLPPIHVAFRSDSRTKIRAFYEAALKGGEETNKAGTRVARIDEKNHRFFAIPKQHSDEAIKR